MKSELDNLSLDNDALNQRIREVSKTRNYRKANIDKLLRNVEMKREKIRGLML